jgi:hypothetical protein
LSARSAGTGVDGWRRAGAECGQDGIDVAIARPLEHPPDVVEVARLPDLSHLVADGLELE